MRQAVEIGDSKSIDFSDVKDGAYAEVEAQYDGTMGESVEKATLFFCERTTAKDKADKLRLANTTSSVEEDFGIPSSVRDIRGERGKHN
mgnify:CR=1 FL=1